MMCSDQCGHYHPASNIGIWFRRQLPHQQPDAGRRHSLHCSSVRRLRAPVPSPRPFASATPHQPQRTTCVPRVHQRPAPAQPLPVGKKGRAQPMPLQYCTSAHSTGAVQPVALASAGVPGPTCDSRLAHTAHDAWMLLMLLSHTLTGASMTQSASHRARTWCPPTAATLRPCPTLGRPASAASTTPSASPSVRTRPTQSARHSTSPPAP
jgi:hypothetical protein